MQALSHVVIEQQLRRNGCARKVSALLIRTLLSHNRKRCAVMRIGGIVHVRANIKKALYTAAEKRDLGRGRKFYLARKKTASTVFLRQVPECARAQLARFPKLDDAADTVLQAAAYHKARKTAAGAFGWSVDVGYRNLCVALYRTYARGIRVLRLEHVRFEQHPTENPVLFEVEFTVAIERILARHAQVMRQAGSVASACCAQASGK